MAYYMFTSDAATGIVIPAVPRPLVSILIATYRTGDVLLDALAAIAASTDSDRTPYEVIVVDNAPGTGARETVELLRAKTAGITVVVNDENRGFGGASNQAAELASGEYLALCNPDLLVHAGWLEPLVAALSDPHVGIAGPPLLNADGTLQEAGQQLYNDGLTAPRLPDGELVDSDVDYLSAACWLVRRKAFLDLGGFDPAYHPAYFEDVDYALRVQQNGQVSRLVAATPVVHLHGQSSDGTPPTWAARSHQTLVAKWSNRLQAQPRWPDTETVSAAPRATESARWRRLLWRMPRMLRNKLTKRT